METDRIYLDHAATTPLDAEVLEAMLPFLTERYGNPSSIYRRGREARRALDEARDQVASAIGARSSREIIFTAGGSEADNLALKGVASANRHRGRHIVTSAIEHHAVLDAARFLEGQGFDVTYVQPDASGTVSAEAVKGALRDDTILISVMHANNEVGTVQPIPEIAAVAKERGSSSTPTRCRPSASFRSRSTSSAATSSRWRPTSFTAPKASAPSTCAGRHRSYR